MSRLLRELPRRALHLAGVQFTSLYGGSRFLHSRDVPIPADMDAAFAPIFRKCTRFTMTSLERMYGLYKAVGHVVAAGVPGDFVECGVWRGGSAMVIAETLKSLEVSDRQIYLYDTFKGMAAPTDEDNTVLDHVPAHGLWRNKQRATHNDWCFSPLAEVQENMRSTGYPFDRVTFVEGKVEETLPQIAPEAVALLRLDTDWYESTKSELRHLFPKLSPGGVLIVDDYGYWAGQRKAVDEYLEKHNVAMLLHRIDNSGRMAIKPA
ncbi:MAG: TylF/MycF/NovP-related O-methyltransferase [Thermoanaerobaculia bacterium]